MKFEHPEMLLLLLVPLALGLWTFFKPGAVVTAPVAEGALARQPITVMLLRAGLLLPSVILTGFVFLLARPVADQQVVSRNPKQITNIEILLNASHSMLARAEIGYHCRYCASKVAIGNFVQRRHGNTMGISIFGSRHLDLIPLTADLACVITSIEKTFPDYIAYKIANEENFAAGLQGSIDKLAKEAKGNSEQLLILITDGESKELAAQEEILRQQLKEKNITLYVAMIADGNLAPTLGRLAKETHGDLHVCKDAMGFFEIMRHIDRMNKIVYQDEKPQPVDNNWWILLAMVGLTSLLAFHLATPFRPTPW